MDERRVKELLTRAGAFGNGHFVFTTGVHSATYINKDAVFTRTRITDELCKMFALAFDKDNVEVVAAPEKGAIVLGQGVARWLEHWRTLSSRPEVLSVYADKLEGGGFIFKRGYAQHIPNKRVLVIEDQLTSGGSAKRTVEAVKTLGGIVVGVGALNNGGVTAEDLGVTKLVTLLSIRQQTFAPHECPLCRDGVLINTDMGHGKEFLARQRAPA